MSPALLSSCGGDAVRTDHHEVETREERAAAESVRAYVAAVRAGRLGVACVTLAGSARAQHRCGGRARLPRSHRISVGGYG